MKLKKLVLDINEQTEDALKHIYTLLLANPEIEVSIDLPHDKVRNDSDSGESSAEDFAQTLDVLGFRRCSETLVREVVRIQSAPYIVIWMRGISLPIAPTAGAANAAATIA